jgi:dTDP-4-amino-4,6-dideoxygalactose transaminase
LWVDIVSSFQEGVISAGFLRAQREKAWEITRRRLAHWQAYHEAFAPLERAGLCRRPVVPEDCQHNAHMYYLLLPTPAARAAAIAQLKAMGIGAIFHYVPLHSSPAGKRLARHPGSMAVTDRVAGTLLRLPMYVTLDADQGVVIDAVRASLGAARPASATVP